MKNITRRGSLFILCIFTVLFSLIFSVSAFALTEGDWEFKLLDDEVTITGYTGSASDIIIPSHLYGQQVTKVDIGNESFKNAVSVSYPEGVTFISMSGFSDKLETVKLPESLEEIDNYTFRGCKNLSYINLPRNLKKIGIEVFRGCKSLKTISIPDSVVIGIGAFEDCGLEYIDFTGTAPDFKDASYVFKGCVNLKTVILPEGMTKIPLEMFSGCSSLTSVSIPNTVTEIDGYAFDGCESLETLILPTSLKKIAGGIISKTNIKELVIPYGAEEILGNGVSTYTNSLTAVYVPDTVTQISRILLECPNAIVYCTENSATAKNCKKNNISYLTDKSVNSSITVYYNGTRVSFHTYDQNPELINNRTLVPLRAIFEAMNAEVNWDQDTQTVTATRNNSTITLKIGSSELNKDGQSIPVDVPAQIINSRTMVPVRVIAEAFGADVQWNASGKTILINE